MLLEIVWTRDSNLVGREEQEASIDGVKLSGKNMIADYAADRVELRRGGDLIWSHTGRRKDRRTSGLEAPQIFAA